jgi:hypothetical protein
MVLWHVENFAVTQQVDLKVGDFALFLNPEGEVFHGCDVGTIESSFEGTPIPAANLLFQALYAWMMTFGCMGMFRSLLTKENRTIRYVSDSSYWLYLEHLPLFVAWLLRQD